MTCNWVGGKGAIKSDKDWLLSQERQRGNPRQCIFAYIYIYLNKSTIVGVQCCYCIRMCAFNILYIYIYMNDYNYIWYTCTCQCVSWHEGKQWKAHIPQHRCIRAQSAAKSVVEAILRGPKDTWHVLYMLANQDICFVACGCISSNL